jgi:ABC-type dipeptide/oligopeptide/nickel transport system ATPase component
MGNLLEIKNLKVEFHLDERVITAVDGAYLNIKENEVVVLAGESGSGKTITALSICKILPRNAHIVWGVINLAGREMLCLNENELIKIRGKDIAYIFQEPVSFLNPVYTIGEQIIEVIKLHQGKNKKEAYEETIDLLKKVRIWEAKRVFQSYPHQLSGGLNQRAFIAMSLACNPKLLIADEPTTSLDVTIEKEILDLLLELKNKLKFSLLFITHNLSIAQKIADRIFIMYKGRVVEEADSQELFKSAKHFHTQELLSAYERIGRI